MFINVDSLCPSFVVKFIKCLVHCTLIEVEYFIVYLQKDGSCRQRKSDSQQKEETREDVDGQLVDYAVERPTN